MYRLISICLMLIFFSCEEKKDAKKDVAENSVNSKTQSVKNIYSYKVKDIYGKDFDFASLKGKKLMIVNTASKCGLTPQYELLEKLYQENKDNNFVIVGFPANNFGAQEPGSDSEIIEFCKKNYGVSFPMMSKISVKGDDQHKIYKFLTDKNLNGKMDSEVTWNFQKYLIDENGDLANVIEPKTLPTDSEVINFISGR